MFYRLVCGVEVNRRKRHSPAGRSHRLHPHLGTGGGTRDWREKNLRIWCHPALQGKTRQPGNQPPIPPWTVITKSLLLSPKDAGILPGHKNMCVNYAVSSLRRAENILGDRSKIQRHVWLKCRLIQMLWGEPAFASLNEMHKRNGENHDLIAGKSRRGRGKAREDGVKGFIKYKPQMSQTSVILWSINSPS